MERVGVTARLLAAALMVLVGSTLAGCASKPPAVQTGFLSDYSRLRAESDSRLVYASDALASYDAFIIDPIELRVPPGRLSREDTAEVARYFLTSAERTVRAQGLRVTNAPGAGVARVQIALTGIAESSWWRKIHPVWRAAGAGTGGAAMEAEVVDSVTGQQLAAVVHSVAGNQFDFTAFSTLADVKSAIDKWAESGGRDLRMLRERSARTAPAR